jgi:Ca-activated chloride channel family protein
MGFRLAHPGALLLLLLVPAAAALLRYADGRRRSALLRFSQLSGTGSPVDPGKRRRKRDALVAALACLIVALARPVWIGGPAAPPQDTADVVFLLDVSRSMLADDARPTRLERAKSIVADLVRQFRTERAALVTFAGNCAVQCPLTIDYDYFRDRLDTANTDSITRGGTRIGDAITFALNTAFDDVQRGRKQLVLLTDGGDQDRALTAAARLATERKVRIVAIGIGDDRAGATVPVSAADRRPFLYQGQPVTTRLEGAAMESLAGLNRGGVYLRAGTGDIDSANVYRQMLSASSPLTGGPPHRETEGYPVPLALAIALLIAESLVSDRKMRAAAAVLLLVVALPGRSAEEDPVEAGNREFAARYYPGALRYYLAAADSAPNSPQVLFDLALTFYKTESYVDAAATYRRAAALSHDSRFRAQCKFGEANAAYRIAMQRSRQLFDFEQALSLTIPIYREALALDPSLIDCKYNIEVIKRKLRDLAGPMRAATNRFMVRSRQDLARRQNTEASRILQENRNARRTKGQVGRPTIDTDW